MGFVSFLKKVGQGVIKYLPAALGIGGIVAAANPAVQPVIDELKQIQSLALTLERAFAKAGIEQAGPKKFLALVSFTEELLRNSELVAQHEIADEVLFGKGANEIAQGVVDVLQSLKGQDGTIVVGTSTVKA